MIEKLLKAVKRGNKKKSLNITTATVIGFLLSCSIVLGEGLEITQETGEGILFNEMAYDKATHPFKENTFVNNIYVNNMEIATEDRGGGLALAIEIEDNLELEIYNNNLISVVDTANVWAVYNSGSQIKKIENNGMISAKGGNSSSGIYSLQGSIGNITNNGTIIVETTKTSQPSHGIYNISTVGEIVNNGTISAEAKGNTSDGYGIYNRFYSGQGTIEKINNNGLILGKGKDFGLGIWNYQGIINIIENGGIIYGSADTNAAGIRNEKEGVIKKINNNGKIVGVSANKSYGIWNISNGGADIEKIENTGIIYGNGNRGFGIFNNQGIIKKIENSGLIIGVGSSSEGHGIQNANNFSDNPMENLRNTGKIIGLSSNNHAYGITGNNPGSKSIDPIENLGMIVAEGKSSGNGFYAQSINGDTVNNFGIIFGSTYAIDGSNSGATTGNNYGLLINKTESGNVINSLTIGNAGEGDSKITNYGIVFKVKNNGEYDVSYRHNGSENVTVDMFSKERDMKVKNASTSTSGSESFSDKTYENSIVNGITDTIKVSGTENAIKGSVVNAYTSAIKFGDAEDNSLVISGSIINGGLDNNGVAIKGDSRNDELILESGEITFKDESVEKINTVINGNIDLGNGDNKLTISGGTVINGEILAGTGKDILIFGKKDTERNVETNETKEINIFNNIKGFDETSISGNVTIFDKTYVFNDDLTVTEENLKAELGDITLENGSNLTLRIDGTQRNGENKIIGHALYENTGSITSNGGKLLLDVGTLSNGTIINFGETELDESIKGSEINYSLDMTVDALSLLHNVEKLSDKDVVVKANENLPEMPYPDGLDYIQLNKIYQGILSTDQIKYFDVVSKENLSTFLEYLNNIYAGNPYSYSSELSRKSMGMFRDIVTENHFKPNLNKWTIYGGLTHIDGGTKDTYYGKGYYTYDIGSSDIDADTEITGAYMLGEYGISDTLASGVVIGGNKLKSDLSNGSKLDGDALYMGAYAKKYIGNLKVTAGFGFQYGEYDADRLAVNRVASSIAEPVVKYSDNYNDITYDIYLNGRYSHNIGDNLFLEPYGTLSYVHIDQEKANEGSKVLAIETDSKSFDYTSAKIGIDLKKVIPHEKGKSTLSAGVSYTRLLSGADEEHITGRFSGGRDFDILVAHKNEHGIGLNTKYALEFENGVLFDVKGSYIVERDSHNNSGKNETKGEWIVGTGLGYRF